MLLGIRGLHFKVEISLVWLISNGTEKMKLAILAFLYCGEFVKNPVINSYKSVYTVLLCTRIWMYWIMPMFFLVLFIIFCSQLRTAAFVENLFRKNILSSKGINLMGAFTGCKLWLMFVILSLKTCEILWILQLSTR